jgi:hypothetical protein
MLLFLATAPHTQGLQCDISNATVVRLVHSGVDGGTRVLAVRAPLQCLKCILNRSPS